MAEPGKPFLNTCSQLSAAVVPIDPIQKLVNFGRLYQEGITGFHRFMEMMEVAPDLQDAADAIDLTQVRGHVEFKEVSFKSKEDHNDVVKNLSLEIQAGEYVALVGSSGVGKTTLCSLIPRFYEVTAGKILLDGQDIRDVTLRSLRRNIGIVQQDVYLFAGTVADNIGYGKRDASRQEIIDAAKQAHAPDSSGWSGKPSVNANFIRLMATLDTPMKLARYARKESCDGYLDHPFLNKRYRTRKQPSVLKTNPLHLSVRHAGLLVDNQTPVGSGSIIYASF